MTTKNTNYTKGRRIESTVLKLFVSFVSFVVRLPEPSL